MELEKLKFTWIMRVNRECAAEMEAHLTKGQVGNDFSQNRITMKIDHEVYGQKNTQTYKIGIEFPKNWFWHLVSVIPYFRKYTRTVAHYRSVEFTHKLLFPKVPGNMKAFPHTDKPKEPYIECPIDWSKPENQKEHE